jgi:hypothetical protein
LDDIEVDGRIVLKWMEGKVKGKFHPVTRYEGPEEE